MFETFEQRENVVWLKEKENSPRLDTNRSFRRGMSEKQQPARCVSERLLS